MYMDMLQINEPVGDWVPILALTNNPSNKEMSVMAKSNIPKPVRICQVDGCFSKHLAKGYCNQHYKAHQKYGVALKAPEKENCKVEDCNGRHKAHGYCDRHYYQHKRHGMIFDLPVRNQKDPNDFILKGDICEITLFDKNGFMTGKAIVDAEDYEKVIGFKWHMRRRPDGNKYVITCTRTSRTYLHRLVLSSSTTIDHINGNGLDNRKCNLRECTNAENICNTGPQKNKKIKLKGVYANGDSWRARIMKDGIRYNIGSYQSPIAAAIAYNNTAKERHGEFAYINNVYPEVI